MKIIIPLSLSVIVFSTEISSTEMSSTEYRDVSYVQYRDVQIPVKGGASERCEFSQFGKRQFSYGIYN